MEKQTAIQIFLAKHNISQYRVAKLIGASKSTISTAEKKRVDNLSVRVLRGIAEAANMSPGDTLNELLTIEGVETMKNYINNFQNCLNNLIDQMSTYPNSIFNDIHSAASMHLPTYFESWEVEKDKMVISGDNITVEIALDNNGSPTKKILSVFVKGDPDVFVPKYETSEISFLNEVEAYEDDFRIS